MSLVFQISRSGSSEWLNHRLLGWFFVELNLENCIRCSFQYFSKFCHRAGNFLLEVVRTMHVFKYIEWNMHRSSKLILNCDFLSFNVPDNIVCCLREPLCYLKFLRIPKWLRGSSWLRSNESSANDEGRSFDEVLVNLCFCLILDSLGKIAHCDLWRWRHDKFVSVLHNIEHKIAVLIHFDNGEIDLTSGKFAHLIPNVEAVRRTFRILIADGVTGDVNTVSWSISDQKGLFDWAGTPFCF